MYVFLRYFFPLANLLAPPPAGFENGEMCGKKRRFEKRGGGGEREIRFGWYR